QPYPQALTLGGWSKALDVGGSGGRYALLFKITFDDETYTWFMPGPLRFTSGTHEWELRETSHVWNRDVMTIQPYVILYDCTGTVWFDDMFVRTVPRLLGRVTHFWEIKVKPFWEIKVKPYLLHPGHFFTQTARGTAAWDTLSMVKDHPWGVGAGNWGFAYPLYHKHMTKRAFSENIQIRRAHNDYIEYLGELGWPGLLILLSLVIIPLRDLAHSVYKQDGKERAFSICLFAQLTSCLMFGLDYFLEYPFRKFLFVVLIALAISPLSCQPDKQINAKS
ncbi:O-antigen ligase family protein, partial [bacterium]|nr:O-antigen ligase family protein [bacterium]